MRTNKVSSLSAIGEFGLIHLLKKTVHTQTEIIRGIGDDTAVLPFSKDKYLLFTTDMLVEGVHFLETDSRKEVGRKALGANISDIATMGGISRFAVVAMGLPSKVSVYDVKEIYRGMNTLAKQFNVSITGGDTVRAPKTIINVALIGEVEKKCLVLREGAKPGDKIFVTGRLGKSFQNKKHLCFMPRQKEARCLVKNYKPSAMIDVTDGFIADLNHIVCQSQVGAILYEDAIPKTRGASLRQAFYDGEDFELIFTLSAEQSRVLLRRKDMVFFCVGEIVSDVSGINLLSDRGILKKIPMKGYQHF
jgi:thiamine-monophosphate kinase